MNNNMFPVFCYPGCLDISRPPASFLRRQLLNKYIIVCHGHIVRAASTHCSDLGHFLFMAADRTWPAFLSGRASCRDWGLCGHVRGLIN
jgi:hypothetical protein